MDKYSKLSEKRKNFYRKIFKPLAKFLLKNRKDYFTLWEELGLHIVPNHFYEPIPDTRFLPDNRTKIFDISNLNFNDKKQLKFLEKVKFYNKELLDYLNKKESHFFFGNGLYDTIDAILYYSILREIKPKKIIEIGSGFSTIIASIAGEINGNIEITCIDPYSNIDKYNLSGIKKIIKKPVEKIDKNFFYNLSDNDILFIDSSHTVKTGNDVVYLFLEILPFLEKKIFIHFHDIFIPLDYPILWIKEEKRFWNEQYLLHSFLCENKKFDIFFATSYMGYKYPEIMRKTFKFPENIKKQVALIFKKFFPEINWWGGGSFWIQSMTEK